MGTQIALRRVRGSNYGRIRMRAAVIEDVRACGAVRAGGACITRTLGGHE